MISLLLQTAATMPDVPAVLANAPSGPTLWQIILYVGVGFSAATTIIGVLLKLLLTSYKKNMALELATITGRADAFAISLQKDFTTLRESLLKDVTSLKEDYGRAEASTQTCFDQIEKQRDRWETFLKEFHILDTITHQKVDALFRTVDTTRETLKELRPGLLTKIEEISKRLSVELQLYVRDTIKKEATQ